MYFICICLFRFGFNLFYFSLSNLVRKLLTFSWNIIRFLQVTLIFFNEKLEMLPWQLIEINTFKLTIIQWPRAITNNKRTIKVCYVLNLHTSCMSWNVLFESEEMMRSSMHVFKLAIWSGLSSLTPNTLVPACPVTDEIPPLESHMGLEQYESEQRMTEFTFLNETNEWQEVITESLMD